ncbi:MAG: AMP-binding protein [Chloroflexi bacterium]|nr:AMP-binding protein [Chloroflexota bacterium]
MQDQGKQREYFDAAKETMAYAERGRQQEARLRHIVAHAYAKALTFREKCQLAGVDPEMVRTLSDLERIPMTRKDDLLELHKQRPFGGLLGVPPQKLKRAFISPGPIYDPEGEEEDYWRWAGPLCAAGFREGDVALNSVSYHLTPLGWMFDEGLRALGCTVLPGGTGNTEQQVKLAVYAGATAYVGTPSFLMMLLEKAEELGFELGKDLRLRCALVAGEMLPESLRHRIQEKAGATIRQAYGTADLGAVAYECREGRGMHIADDVVVEIVDPSTGKQVGPGESGEIVVTSFDETYCLIRFGTGDLSYMTNEPCPCGRTSPRLVRIVGRIGDAVKVRGMFVHPREIDNVISRYPQVAAYQIVVTRPGVRDEMLLRVELQSQANEQTVENKESLRRELREKMGEALKLKIDNLEFVAPATLAEGAKKVLDERKWD